MEYDHQCICGHREKDHAPGPQSSDADLGRQNRPCNVCNDCEDYKGTNIISTEKSET